MHMRVKKSFEKFFRVTFHHLSLGRIPDAQVCIMTWKEEESSESKLRQNDL